jgi:ribonuclease HI
MNILKKHSFGMKMNDVETYKDTLYQIIEGFVDDTSIFTNDEGGDLKSLREKLETDGAWWAGLLESSGGKLELTKCFYYLLSWKWDEKGNPIPEMVMEQSITESGEKISLNKNNNKPIYLEQKEIGSSHKTLGTYKCIIGKETDHSAFLRNKSDSLAELTIKSQFNKRQSRRAFNSCYVPALLYSLTAVSLSQQQTDKIQQKATAAYLRKCGYEMHFPRKVVYCPVKLGGLGFNQLYVESCCNKITTLLSHVNDQTSLGTSMEIILNWTQLHSGLSTPILENKMDLGYLQSNWFTQLREFLLATNSKIIMRAKWLPTIKREGDFALMDRVSVMDLNHSSKIIFNNWRLYFQVETMADVANIEGNKIEARFLNKKLIKDYKSETKHRWPQQKMPHIKHFNIWVKTLKRICNMNECGFISKKLGNWLVIPAFHRDYKSLIHITTNNVIMKDDINTWTMFEKSHSGRTTHYYIHKGSRDILDIDYKYYVPVELTSEGKYYQVKKRNLVLNQFLVSQQPLLRQNIKTISVQEYIQTNSNIFKTFLKSTVINDERWLLDNFCQGIVLCSDGGAKNGDGSYGIVVMDKERVILASNSRIPEVYEEVNCHRSECFGVLISLKLIELIHNYIHIYRHNLAPYSVRIICDNEAAVKTINKIKETKLTLKQQCQANIDILRAMKILISKLKERNCMVRISHVYGHQDEKKNVLSVEEQMNTKADELATIGLKKRKVQPLYQGIELRYGLTINKLHQNILKTYENVFTPYRCMHI